MSHSTGYRSAKDFVLTKEQLELERYPMPGNYCNMNQKDKSRFSLCKFMKDNYKDLTSSSKMFALDCEMVENYSGQWEVVSICIVNEDLVVIYKTLVKPECRIKDYRSQFTGINAESLRNVTTTLADVHKFLREQLPDDAILVGQSLNFDLLALKLMHPYIIDTSVVYNTSGDIFKKDKLKDLAKKYLNVTIQAGLAGVHSAEEDALTAMKLIKLRIEKGPLPGMKPYNSVKKPCKSRNPQKFSAPVVFDKHCFYEDIDDTSYDDLFFGEDLDAYDNSHDDLFFGEDIDGYYDEYRDFLDNLLF